MKTTPSAPQRETTTQPSEIRASFGWSRACGSGAPPGSLAEIMLRSLATRPVWVADLFWG